ncbi:SDR family NAD(P)-dependent oxidoreductase [Palleronia caenipelagi]|uniref:SDR family oxidoreductase n=1 Tax=Palleronia caenipelagi TaxID=2489174 RepID=A0A547PLN4_9RHOB|nr:SDR family NAD(P)-dependent oxidoreductase [Palleronia caenipelagi]TRD15037.1 SDR family oxidoreductase [Palleronia caenipelagi]
MKKGLSLFALDGKTAVVTGASRGIGEAISRQLAEMGAHVVMADLVDDVKGTAQKLSEEGLNVSPALLDVTDSAAVAALADSVVETHGHVDILVANAGIVNDDTTETTSDATLKAVMDVNVNGVFYCIRAFGQKMLAQGSGSIIGISSISGVRAVHPERHSVYDASKAAVAHFCKAIGVEWAGRGVRVNAVGPGYTNTTILQGVGRENPEVMKRWLHDIPMKRLLEPSEIAATIGFLASDAASGITGQLVMTDAGYSVA